MRIDVLLVEDNPGDVRLIVELLRPPSDVQFVVESVGSLHGAVERLRLPDIDVVLLDLGLPDSVGFDTFERLRTAAAQRPIVVISGLADERVALEAVRAGAQDYLVKGRLGSDLLMRVIRYAIERRRAELTLLAREEQFRQLVENMTEVFFVMDAAFRKTLYVSPAYERIWGHSCESLYESPTSFMQHVLEEDRWIMLQSIDRVQRGADPGEVEFRIVHPTAGIRWQRAHAAPIRDAQGTVYRIVGVALDVTERHLAEQALRASEARARMLFQTVNLIVLGLSADGRVEYVNPFYEHLTGFSHDTVVGTSWPQLVPPAERPRVEDLCASIARGDVPAHLEGAIVTHTGEPRLVRWHNTVLRDQSDRPTGTLSIGEDITDRTRLEEQFRQAQKMEAVGLLAGGVAHDFNNILTAVLGYAEIAADQAPVEAPLHGDLQEVIKAAHRATLLTKQLLAFSRQQVLDIRVVHLNDVVTDVHRMLSRIIGEQIHIQSDLAADAGNVCADAGQLQQVLMNLAVNARDAMPDGGHLTIRTRNINAGQIPSALQSVLPINDYVMLSVSDTGVGMSAETQSRMFEPFFTTKERGRGTGLGLATVFGIVQQSAGFIWTESSPGQGTTFSIYLPRVHSPVDPVIPPRLVETHAGTETILVAEDDDVIRQLARSILERLGYTVIAVGNGEDAMAAAEAHPAPIHLLLTDVVMPGVKGPELAQRLRARRPETRVLFMSGYTDDAAAGVHMRPDDPPILQKPFTPATLLRRVREVLQAP